MNLLKGEMQNGHFVGEGFQVTLPSHISGDIAEIGIRPQAMQMTDDGPLIGQVDFVEALGSGHLSTLCGATQESSLTSPPSVTVGAGDTVRFHVDECHSPSSTPGLAL